MRERRRTEPCCCAAARHPSGPPQRQAGAGASGSRLAGSARALPPAGRLSAWPGAEGHARNAAEQARRPSGGATADGDRSAQTGKAEAGRPRPAPSWAGLASEAAIGARPWRPPGPARISRDRVHRRVIPAAGRRAPGKGGVQERGEPGAGRAARYPARAKPKPGAVEGPLPSRTYRGPSGSLLRGLPAVPAPEGGGCAPRLWKPPIVPAARGRRAGLAQLRDGRGGAAGAAGRSSDPPPPVATREAPSAGEKVACGRPTFYQSDSSAVDRSRVSGGRTGI